MKEGKLRHILKSFEEDEALFYYVSKKGTYNPYTVYRINIHKQLEDIIKQKWTK